MQRETTRDRARDLGTRICARGRRATRHAHWRETRAHNSARDRPRDRECGRAAARCWHKRSGRGGTGQRPTVTARDRARAGPERLRRGSRRNSQRKPALTAGYGIKPARPKGKPWRGGESPRANDPVIQPPRLQNHGGGENTAGLRADS